MADRLLKAPGTFPARTERLRNIGYARPSTISRPAFILDCFPAFSEPLSSWCFLEVLPTWEGCRRTARLGTLTDDEAEARALAAKHRQCVGHPTAFVWLVLA
jgi:hypothetical protein